MAVVSPATALQKNHKDRDEPLQYVHVQGYQTTLNTLGVSRIVVRARRVSIPLKQNHINHDSHICLTTQPVLLHQLRLDDIMADDQNVFCPNLSSIPTETWVRNCVHSFDQGNVRGGVCHIRSCCLR